MARTKLVARAIPAASTEIAALTARAALTEGNVKKNSTKKVSNNNDDKCRRMSASQIKKTDCYKKHSYKNSKGKTKSTMNSTELCESIHEKNPKCLPEYLSSHPDVVPYFTRRNRDTIQSDIHRKSLHFNGGKDDWSLPPKSRNTRKSSTKSQTSNTSSRASSVDSRSSSVDSRASSTSSKKSRASSGARATSSVNMEKINPVEKAKFVKASKLIQNTTMYHRKSKTGFITKGTEKWQADAIRMNKDENAILGPHANNSMLRVVMDLLENPEKYSIQTLMRKFTDIALDNDKFLK